MNKCHPVFDVFQVWQIELVLHIKATASSKNTVVVHSKCWLYLVYMLALIRAQ